ncbi:Steroid 17-alpha-hydroxylase/17,20 lyase [Termitomyces sp. J132]|nr:Steroid 17-alpha-hydroxylase/17,20 lyase [Termitomyces sp. J132]
MIENYGSLVSLNLAGYTVILIGDLTIAKELLEKHSAKHSSRPAMHYFKHVDPEKNFWGLNDSDEEAHLGRKLTARIMSLVRTGKSDPLQEYEAILNIQHLLDDGGKDWFRHIERVVLSTVFSAAFGMDFPTGREPALQIILDLLAEVVYLGTPSASITNIFPLLDLIPGRMPWRMRAQSFLTRNNALYEKLMADAVSGKASGINTWAAYFAREDKPEGDQRHLVRMSALAAIASTTISLHTFVLACIRYPDWIATAQREIDKIVGTGRLPTFKDRPFLPYVDAVVRETLRWRPAGMLNVSAYAPLSVGANFRNVVRSGAPRCSIADDIVGTQGQWYFIPKGSIIFPVTWAIEHDQSKFEYHDRFIPERFLDSEGNLKPNYETSAFGFACPGITFGERLLWINISIMLWTFNIRASNETIRGTGLPFQYDDSDAAFNGDITNRPFEFPAVFEPRSPQQVEVARREWAECEKDLHVLMPIMRDD